jgi:SRSO17 transposase
VKTTKDLTVAAGHSIDAERWRAGFEVMVGRIAGRFARVESRRRARALLLGLLAPLPRKNCWTLAEHAGDGSPDGMQHLLARAVWDADAVRDDLRDYVVEHLEDGDAVLVVDETGDLKKGTGSVGVQRQYTGTAGRIENAQVAVYLVYAAAAGHAAIDRELYVPRCWIEDPARCAAAGMPHGLAFATKPQLAARMITRALDAGVAASWVAGDEVYGANTALREQLERRAVGYVLAVARDHRAPTGIGPVRCDALAAMLPKRAWQRMSAGGGAKGERYYDWAVTDLAVERPGTHQVLIRRNRRTGELAFYRCFAPGAVPLRTLVRVAGRRWAVEETFQAAKGLTGLDEHQVRRWTSWYRWTTLAMLAHAFLAVVGALIPLTCNEIQRLLHQAPQPRPAAALDWSHWRRRHQARAQASHYRRQATYEP